MFLVGKTSAELRQHINSIAFQLNPLPLLRPDRFWERLRGESCTCGRSRMLLRLRLGLGLGLGLRHRLQLWLWLGYRCGRAAVKFRCSRGRSELLLHLSFQVYGSLEVLVSLPLQLLALTLGDPGRCRQVAEMVSPASEEPPRGTQVEPLSNNVSAARKRRW